jgi:signal transduction histidine kinase
LVRVPHGQTTWQITHAAWAEGISPVPTKTDLPTALLPWVSKKVIEQGEVLYFTTLEDLSAEASIDKQTYQGWGIRSCANIPIVHGLDHYLVAINTVRGERVWPEEYFPRLRLLGEILVNALERKRAEAEVARARTELLHVERSLRLSELTASLAHELNQPLAAILSNAQAALRFLKSDKPDLNEFREIMRDIISDDQRAGNVIRSLRSMMKREEGEKRPTLLNDILNDVIQIFRSEAIFQNVHIETELDGSLPPVLGDRGQLQQVVLNIVMNAAEAMSRNPPEQRKLILRTQGKDHRLWMTARDFGPGIDKENLERVFQPFFTTKGTGLGMGLAVCSSIIKEHRGRIWAENNSDAGATFFIELPVLSDQ